MKARQLIAAGLFIGLVAVSTTNRADDIDIYASNTVGGVNTPNMMFALDSSSNSDANFGTCTYLDGTAPSLNGTNNGTPNMLGAEQCALSNIAEKLPTHKVVDPATGLTKNVAYINLGITTSNGLLIPLTPIDDNPYTGPTTVGLISIPANTTNRQAFIMAVRQGYKKNTGSVDQGQEMQETWAYYTGGNQGANGVANNKGSITGQTFAAGSGVAASGCMHNYITFLGGSNQSNHIAQTNDGTSPLDLLTAVNNDLVNKVIDQVTATTLSTPLPYPSAIDPEKPWAMEWARYAYTVSANHTSAGAKGITTYTVNLEGGDAGMDTYWANLAAYGGGKSYVATDYNSLVSSILKVLNEVQAVNSVFSSSSLPVSVNAQGTYLNQIYMGMFRPDAQANPRWVGNVKQYQFIYNRTTGGLSLGDALANPALSSSGTGFISPNAISFWTCTDLTTSPIPNPYVSSTSPVYVSSTQLALLRANNQDCTDPPKGFWASDPGSATSIAQGYDLPDGERVERGGAAQQIRHTNLTDDYTASPAAPRKVYTYCPTGASCVNALTDPSNVFATSNTGVTSSTTAFGTTSTANISGMVRNAVGTAGNVVTVTTTGAHYFNSNDQILIQNASDGTYDGTFPITVVDATHFTYLVTESPPNNLTFAGPTYPYTASLSGAAAVPIATNGIVRSGNTVTVTTSLPHNLPSPSGIVVIAGANPAAYNGTFTYTYISTTQFSFTITEQPPTTAGGITATSATVTGFTNPACKANQSLTVYLNAVGATTPGVQRTLGSTLATYTTSSSIATFQASCGVTVSGVTDANGIPVAAYNGTFNQGGAVSALGTISGNTFTVTGIPLSPTTPGTGGTVSLASTVNIAGLAYADDSGAGTATVTATTATVHGFSPGQTVGIGGTGPGNQLPYLGSFTILAVPTTTSFTYRITTLPITPAQANVGMQMTATRSTGLQASQVNALINWTRGQDNVGDEFSLCPGGVSGSSTSALPGKNYTNCPSPVVTIRPSVHGDVLHSRPTVVNYGSYPIAITATSDSGTGANVVRTATASSGDVTTISQTGATPIVTFANTQSCPVTITGSTTFQYSATNCGNAGPQTAHVGSKVVVFYGDNGGLFHAVNGNQTMTGWGAGPGGELWSFIPREFFIKLMRQWNNSPQVDLPSTPPGISPTPIAKDYFVDGVPGLYQYIDSTSGNTLRAVLYLSMRRGGNFIYALDVTDPTQPTVLWKVDNTSTGMSELGQTWSQPKVAWVKGYNVTDSKTGAPRPVLIFGGGYSLNEDNEPMTNADGHGRAIFVLDSLTGALIWKAKTSGGGATNCGTSTTCLVQGMDYAIPSDITLVDRNYDGNIDRLYVGDLGGNIWRVDLEPGCNGATTCTTAAPSYWNVHQLAALGCATGACSNPASPKTQRKFFYPPEVILATATEPYDAVFAGSGDREHPLYVSSGTQPTDAIYMLKDTYQGDDATGMQVLSMSGTNSLFNATTTPWDGSLNGYYINLGTAEKVVNAPLAVAGLVYMSTNTPSSPNTNSCTASLGIAKGYVLSPFTGTYRVTIFDGGGLPPSPVAGVVNVLVDGTVKAVPFLIGGSNPDCTGSADCKSALGGQRPKIAVPTTRHRTYWYLKGG